MLPAIYCVVVFRSALRTQLFEEEYLRCNSMLFCTSQNRWSFSHLKNILEAFYTKLFEVVPDDKFIFFEMRRSFTALIYLWLGRWCVVCILLVDRCRLLVIKYGKNNTKNFAIFKRDLKVVERDCWLRHVWMSICLSVNIDDNMAHENCTLDT